MIKEAYCSFEVAKLLKKKEFDVPCDSYYDYFSSNVTMYQGYVAEFSGSCTNHNGSKNYDIFSRPTHQMAMAWLREEKRTAIIIEFDVTKRGFCPYVHQLDYDMEWVVKWRINMPMKYEEAVESFKSGMR